MSPKKTVLILSFSQLERDNRILRQISWLKDSYSVVAVGFSDPQIEGVEFVPIHIKSDFFSRVLKGISLKLRRFEAAYWDMFTKSYFDAVWSKLAYRDYAIIIANEIETLPLALNLKMGKPTPVIFDAHEYAPKEFEDRFVWRFFYTAYYNYLCREYIPKCAKLTTVSEGLAEGYKNNFRADCEVITSACEYHELEPTPTNSDTIKLIHHGIASRARGLEIMIEAMKYTDKRFVLDLMLMPTNPKYYKKLKKLAEKTTNVRIKDPVSYKELIYETSKYDIGINTFMPFITFNLLNSLPNKFFQYVQARIALVVGPTPSVAKLVKEHHLGIVVSDFDPKLLAAELNQLTTEKIDEYKRQVHASAKALSDAPNKAKFLAIVKSLVK